MARFLKNVVDDGDVNTNTKSSDEDGIEYESDDDDDDAKENADDIDYHHLRVFAAIVLPPTDDTGFNPPLASKYTTDVTGGGDHGAE